MLLNVSIDCEVHSNFRNVDNMSITEFEEVIPVNRKCLRAGQVVDVGEEVLSF